MPPKPPGPVAWCPGPGAAKGQDLLKVAPEDIKGAPKKAGTEEDKDGEKKKSKEDEGPKEHANVKGRMSFLDRAMMSVY